MMIYYGRVHNKMGVTIPVLRAFLMHASYSSNNVFHELVKVPPLHSSGTQLISSGNKQLFLASSSIKS